MVNKKHEPLPDEKEIVGRARTGDKDAYRQIVEAYQDRLFGVVLGMVRDRAQAEDLIQEIFVKAFFALYSFSGDSQFYTWIYRIASNHCLDHLRKRRPIMVALDQTIDTDEEMSRVDGFKAPTAEEPGKDLESEGEIVKLLDLLTPDQKLVLTLREVEGHTYEEIADISKCTVNTVKSRINRAREALKQAYIHRFGNIPETKNV